MRLVQQADRNAATNLAPHHLFVNISLEQLMGSGAYFEFRPLTKKN